MQDEQQPKETWNVSDGKVEKNEFTTTSGLVAKDNSGVINYTVHNYGRGEPEQPFENNSQSDFACSGESPYRGLKTFQEEDKALFFGRDKYVAELCNQIQNHSLVALAGVSGSGKSSLVFAGLIPRLRQDGWLIASCRPQKTPFVQLETALLDLAKNQSIPSIEEKDWLIRSVTRILKSNSATKLLLVIDQFEELFDKCEELERTQFIKILLEGIRKIPALKVVLTFRADFYGKLLEDEDLPKALQENFQLPLGSMDKEELKAAIECPVKDKATFQTGLVQQILEDMGTVSGNLPLLESALDELWKQGKLTLDAYREIGGVREALAKRADSIYEGYENNNKGKQVEKLFRQLVAVSEDTADTRRIVTQSQIKDWKLVEELATERLLVIGQDEKSKETTVELIHEALIQEWQKLRGWVSDKREDSIKVQRIESAAKEWERNNKAVSYLWQQQRLKDAIKVLAKQNEIEPLSLLAQNFINMSKTEVRRKLILNCMIGAVFFCFAGSIIGYYSHQENNRRLKQSALRGETNLEIFQAIPGWLQEAKNKQREGKVVEAIAIARENARIMENWRKAITTNLEQSKQPSMDKVKEFSEQAEEQQVLLIEQYRLPKLEDELKEGRIGNALPNTDLSKSCDQWYEEGALRTTCSIIFQDLGAAADPLVSSQEKADSTPNLIDTQEESDRVPYQILIDIEKSWRENTKDRGCGWLGSQEYGLSEPRCKELKGKSLVKEIFASPFNVPIERLEQCKISRFKELQSSQKLVKPKECK